MFRRSAPQARRRPFDGHPHPRRLIEHALGIAQNRLTNYCRPIEPTFLARLEAARPRDLWAVSTAWYGRVGALPQRYDQSRYHGLNLNSLFFRGTIEFRYFNGTLHAGEIKAYVQFVLALAAKGLNARNTISKRREFNVATAKSDFRVFLLGLGLIGNEFKTARLHLTKHLAGSAAWKGARRDLRPSAAGRGVLLDVLPQLYVRPWDRLVILMNRYVGLTRPVLDAALFALYAGGRVVSNGPLPGARLGISAQRSAESGLPPSDRRGSPAWLSCGS